LTHGSILDNSETHDGAIKSALKANMTLLHAYKWNYK
jgi:hypothetical protein